LELRNLLQYRGLEHLAFWSFVCVILAFQFYRGYPTNCPFY